MPNNQPERILCAAVHYDDNWTYPNQPVNIGTGIVVCGYRHSDCYTTLEVLLKERYNEALLTKQSSGFITSHKRFVNRSEAFKIAQTMKQMWHTMNDKDETNILTSEDLYYGFD